MTNRRSERADPLRRLVFQPVSTTPAGETRIHLDITLDDIDAGVVVVMADPEGNEFRLAQYF